jgi:sRNA-binding protein
MQPSNTLRAVPAADRQVDASDNRPALVTNDQLLLDHASIVDRVIALEVKAAEAPDFVELGDEASQGSLQDLIKLIDAESKLIEARRETTKEPFLSASRVVDGFFKTLADPKGKAQGRLDNIRRVLARTATDFLNRKRAHEQALREAEAKKKRDEEERLRQEQIKREEEAAKLRERNRPTAATEKETQASVAGHMAEAAGASAIELEQSANAKAADLARTRSDAGSLGTLNEFWAYEIVDFDAIEPDAIWDFIPRGDKEKAIKAYMRIHAPKEAPTTPWNPLRGVNFFRTTRGQFR